MLKYLTSIFLQACCSMKNTDIWHLNAAYKSLYYILVSINLIFINMQLLYSFLIMAMLALPDLPCSAQYTFCFQKENLTDIENMESGWSTSKGNFSAGDSIVFNIASAYQINSVVDVPVFIKSNDTIFAIDFSMQYNDQKVVFDSIIPVLNNLQYLYFLNPGDSTLRLTSYCPDGIPEDSVILIIRFQVASGPMCSGEIYNLNTWMNGNVCSNEIIDCIVSGIEEQEEIILEIFPNPATDYISINSQFNGTVTIFDLNAKKMGESIQVEEGKILYAPVANLPSGLYILNYTSAKITSNIRLVISR